MDEAGSDSDIMHRLRRVFMDLEVVQDRLVTRWGLETPKTL